MATTITCDYEHEGDTAYARFRVRGRSIQKSTVETLVAKDTCAFHVGEAADDVLHKTIERLAGSKTDHLFHDVAVEVIASESTTTARLYDEMKEKNNAR